MILDMSKMPHCTIYLGHLVCSIALTCPADVEKELRRMFDVPEETECRVWQQCCSSPVELLPTIYKFLANPQSTLRDMEIEDGQVRVDMCFLMFFSKMTALWLSLCPDHHAGDEA